MQLAAASAPKCCFWLLPLQLTNRNSFHGVHREESWVTVNSEVLRADAGERGRTRRPAASSGTIATCENPATRPGIEPGSSWWKASSLTAQPPRPPAFIVDDILLAIDTILLASDITTCDAILLASDAILLHERAITLKQKSGQQLPQSGHALPNSGKLELSLPVEEPGQVSPCDADVKAILSGGRRLSPRDVGQDGRPQDLAVPTTITHHSTTASSYIARWDQPILAERADASTPSISFPSQRGSESLGHSGHNLRLWWRSDHTRLPSTAERVPLPAGHSPMFAFVNRAGRCHWIAGFHFDATASSALKTSMLDSTVLCAITQMSITHRLLAVTMKDDDRACSLLQVSNWSRVLQEVSNNAWTNTKGMLGILYKHYDVSVVIVEIFLAKVVAHVDMKAVVARLAQHKSPGLEFRNNSPASRQSRKVSKQNLKSFLREWISEAFRSLVDRAVQYGKSSSHDTRQMRCPAGPQGVGCVGERGEGESASYLPRFLGCDKSAGEVKRQSLPSYRDPTDVCACLSAGVAGSSETRGDNMREQVWPYYRLFHKHQLQQTRLYVRQWRTKDVCRTPYQPMRTPDMNPLDHYLWGHLKTNAYATSLDDMDSLCNRIVASCVTIRNLPGIHQRIRVSMQRRCCCTEGLQSAEIDKRHARPRRWAETRMCFRDKNPRLRQSLNLPGAAAKFAVPMFNVAREFCLLDMLVQDPWNKCLNRLAERCPVSRKVRESDPFPKYD
ncbi:hypothetical protein PR048_033156 [Dryococelus australis]|uniref:Uncharacterized protein n=1 Tax=Dryococelus australis TaxID=614101 RepID=A0ABQ9G3N1_9NEOP|nr:hypothetical protein PR048_033156 [Dryococelus australis]